MKTLLIVDVQNDFCPGGALAVAEGDEIIPIINQLMPQFDLVLATQDWHPANHKSFASNNNQQVGEVISLNGQPQMMWPDHCVQNSPGARLHPALQTTAIHHVFQKALNPQIDSYSAFYDNDHRTSTGLTDYLLERNVKKLYICGLATDYCVKFTALDAVQLNFETYLIADACRGVNLQPDDSQNAITKMKEAGVHIIASDVVV